MITFSIGHPTFKIDLPLPWEIKSRYTVKTFVEVVHSSHGNSRSSSLGPYSLRKAGAPVTKMFMAEVPGNADSAMSKGMSIPVDFDANGDAIPRDLDSINIRRAAAENAKASIKTSHFTPSRPDDMTTDTIDQNRLSSRITNISRPDLIGSQKPVESTKKDKRVVSGSYGTQSVPAKNGTVNGSNTIQNNGNNFKSDPNNRESTSQPSLNASVNGIGAELTSSVSPRSSAANITALISTEKVSNPLMSNSNRAVRRSSSVSPNGSPTSRPSLMQANSINIRKEMGNIFSNIGKSNSEQSSESSTALVTSPHQKQSVGRSIKPNRLMMNPLRKDSIPDLPAHLKNKLTRESQAAKDTVPPKKTTMSKMSSFFK